MDRFYLEGSLRGVMAKVLDYCLEVSEFELQSCCDVHFQTSTLGKGMNILIHPQLWVEYQPSWLFNARTILVKEQQGFNNLWEYNVNN